MRAAIYARVSTERQERQQTIDSQLAALSAWAAEAGHMLTAEHVFRDEGHSGARLDRPGLDALRDAVRDAEIDVIGVVSPDRLAREYAYQALILEEFRRAGCAIAFLNHSISDDPGDQLLLQIQGAVAEYERALLGERFRRGKLQKARAGCFIGGRAPYGYRYLPGRDGAGGRLEIDQAEAEFVRMLYGWLVDERLTIRQILKRLNFGPWYPRSGRHPWSPSVVHHILFEPVYTGTAYANRYDFVEAKKPRSRKPSCAGRGCRRMRPREQWIAIAVPPIIDQALWDRAQAQLARNARLSFRNNQKHNHLLRCLLTCGACGLAMHGIARVTAAGAVRSSYRCAGKDCVMTARETACPRAQVDGDRLETAVWEHVRGLLADPERLLAQFERVASGADQASQHAQAAERRIRTRLDRLARADRRLVDAYQAEVISLAELTERRRSLAAQREALEHQGRQQQTLRSEQVKAQAVLNDLTAFCDRIRGRLDAASFADKQAILQLVVERIIVHESSLEIRHVIPLRSPPPGRNGQADKPNHRLRSDGVHHAALPAGVGEVLGRALDQAQTGVRDDQLNAGEATLLEVRQEARPAGLVLLGALADAQDLAVALGRDADRDQERDVAHLARPAAPEHDPVEVDVGVRARDRPVPPRRDLGVDLPVQPAHGAGADPRAPQGLGDVLDPAHGHARQVHLDQGFLDRGLPPTVALDDRGLERLPAQLRHLQRDLAGPGVQPAPVAPRPRVPSRLGALVAGGVA
jgi:site-specific DNA recombinase